MRLEVSDVVDRAGRQVVEDADLVAAREERLGQVRSDESRTASDQHAHQSVFVVIFSRQSVVGLQSSRLTGFSQLHDDVCGPLRGVAVGLNVKTGQECALRGP